MHTRTGFLSFAVLVGCGGGASVEELQRVALHQVTYSDHPGEEEDAYPVQDYIRLRLDLVRKEEPCAAISGAVKATLNGQPMRFVEGIKGEGEFGSSCIPSFFDLHVRRDALPEEPQNAVVELSDGDARTVIEVQGLLARRGMHPSPEAVSEVHAGQEMAFRWYPATDVFVPGNFNRGHAYVAVRAPDERPGNFEAEDKDLDAPGRELVVRIPESAPVGPGVVLWGGRAVPPVLRCEGPAACETIAGVQRQRPVLIQPKP